MRYADTETHLDPHDGGEIYIGKQAHTDDEHGTQSQPRVELEVASDWGHSIRLALTRNEAIQLANMLLNQTR